MPPVPFGKMYDNYTATVQEAVEIAIGVDGGLVVARADDIIADRIAIIANALNINASSFSGSLSLVSSSRRQLSIGWRRRLNDVNTSDCDGGGAVYLLTLIHESDTITERDRVTEYIQANAASALGDIGNADGAGNTATVCVAASVTNVGREVVNAPPPPPLILAQETPPEVPVGTIVIVGTVVVGLGCLCCGLWFAYFVTRRRDDDERESEAKTLLQGTKPKRSVPAGNVEVGVGWKPLRL